MVRPELVPLARHSHPFQDYQGSPKQGGGVLKQVKAKVKAEKTEGLIKSG